jgi:hypothetical protein
MSEENEKKLFEMVKLIGGELSSLRQLVHLQFGTINALREYALSQDVALRKVDRATAVQEMSKRIREAYDQHIQRLEASVPAMASYIDLRGELPDDERDFWYFPSIPPSTSE